MLGQRHLYHTMGQRLMLLRYMCDVRSESSLSHNGSTPHVAGLYV